MAAHKCSFPCNPPGGTWQNPGPCEWCGKTYARSQAERALREAQSAMSATGAPGGSVIVSTEDLRAVLEAWGRNVAVAGAAEAFDRLAEAAGLA